MLFIGWSFCEKHKAGTGVNMIPDKFLSLAAMMLASLNLLSQDGARDPQDRKSIIGINLNGFADWNSEIPLNDVFKLSRKWISQEKGQKWGAGPEIMTDKDGWITGFSEIGRAHV